jgi:hypothetical protein
MRHRTRLDGLVLTEKIQWKRYERSETTEEI